MIAQIFTLIAVLATVKGGAISVVSGGLGLGAGLGGVGLGGIGLGGGIGHGVAVARPAVVDLYTPARYEFQYGVQDAHTGDNKQQSESRVGDTVHGEYSLAEPDGTLRVVKYTADPHNGFNAVVTRIGHAGHPQIVATHGLVGGIGLGGGLGLGGHGGLIG